MGILSVPESLLSKAGVKKPQQVIYGTIVVVVAILIFVIVKKIKQNIDAKTNPGKTKADMEDQLADLNTGGATLSKGDAIIIAQNLLNAMDQFGTDEKAIIDNLNRCKNKADLNLVIQTFGVKPYDGVGLSDTFLSNLAYRLMKNLNGWLRVELSGYYLKETKAIFDNLGVPF